MWRSKPLPEASKIVNRSLDVGQRGLPSESDRPRLLSFRQVLIAKAANFIRSSAREGNSDDLTEAYAELIRANEELAFQNQEKEKRAAELVIANQELAFQNSEKEHRAAELLLANSELAFQNQEKEKRANELRLANIELLFQNNEKEERALELKVTNAQLQESQAKLNEHVASLEAMMFITSHKVRKPVANILGISSILENSSGLPDRFAELIVYIRESAISLDGFTRELTEFINERQTLRPNEPDDHST